MTITKKSVAEKMAAYLRREITQSQLVDWAERAMLDGEFAEDDAKVIAPVVARLGLADVRAFGLTWDDCDSLLRQLGFAARVDVMAM